MAYKIKINTQAEKDVEDAVEWYEDKSMNLGKELLLEFTALVDLISNYPERYPPKLPPFQRALMKKFPYAIYFFVDTPKNEIFIFFGILAC